MRVLVPSRPVRFRPMLLACAAVVALTAAGCKKDGLDSTGSLAAASRPRTTEAWRASAEEWGRKYDAKPGDKTVSLNYAHALRMIDQRQQAVAVLQAAALKTPKDTEILAAYGKALSEVGQLEQARDVLARAHTPERPDWRVLSAQGAVADQLGNQAEAQSLYEAALRLRPNDSGVLSNLGLSYALAKRLPEAETTLRQATAAPGADQRARQNLALVLGLQGKFAEAEQIARQDLSAIDAAQSVAAMRQMVAQPNSWTQIRKMDAKVTAAAGSPASRSAGHSAQAKGSSSGAAPLDLSAQANPAE